MYSSERKEYQINISLGKYYITRGSFIKPLTPNELHLLNKKTIKKFFEITKIFSIYENLDGESISYLTANISFNKIYKKKLTNKKKIMNEYYGFNQPTNKIIHNVSMNQSGSLFKEYKDYLTGWESPNEKLFLIDTYSLLFDTIKMGKTLNKKINLRWSKKRLKIEHDKMSETITNIVMETTDRPLEINELFIKCDKLSDKSFRMLKTTKETALEGLKYKHCVATYTSKIENGWCAIYNYKDSTVELHVNTNDKKITVGQHVVFSNKQPSKLLTNEVLEIVEGLNKKLEEKDFKSFENSTIVEELPF